jgi:hypothetical protein
MKKIIVSIVFVTLATTAFSQYYDQAVGVRGGLFNGVSYKKNLRETNYFEGIVSLRWKGFLVTGLYEKAKLQDFNVERLNWYYGFGAHAGFWDGDYDDYPWDDDNKTYVLLGADAIIGLEYSFREMPVNISLDWKPMINIFGIDGFWLDNIAIGIRYTF